MIEMKELFEKFLKENDIKFNNEENKYDKGIDDENIQNITGGQVISTSINRMFTNNFSKESVKILDRTFSKLLNGEVKGIKIDLVLNEIEKISRDMRMSSEYPLEAILYSSKRINKILENNDILIDKLGDLLKEIYEISPIRNKEAVIYILDNWNWIPQLNIIINTVGKMNDDDLLEKVSRVKNVENKFEVFKCLMNSKNKDYIGEILKTISLTEWGSQVDNKIVKNFHNFYELNFGQIGIDKAMDYKKIPSISKRGKMEISKLVADLGEFSTNIKTVGDIIPFVKDGKFEDVKEFLNRKQSRRNAFVAIRWSRKSDIENWSSIIEKYIKNDFSRENEFSNGEGLITLGKLGSRLQADYIAKIYIENNYALEQAYCTLAIIGNPIYESKVVNELFNMNFKMFSLVKTCVNQIEGKIKEEFEADFFSNNKEKASRASDVAKELANRKLFGFEKTYPKYVAKLLSSNLRILNDGMFRIEIIKSIQELFDDNQKDFIAVLFKILDDERTSDKEKIIANKLLLSVHIAPPK